MLNQIGTVIVPSITSHKLACAPLDTQAIEPLVKEHQNKVSNYSAIGSTR